MNCIDCRYSLLKDGHSNCTYEEGECIKISVLEKENAELKSNFRICEKNADTYYDKLQKANKLLKQWVELYKPKLEGYPITPIQEQTEQFLSEEVEK